MRNGKGSNGQRRNEEAPRIGRPPIPIDWGQFDKLCALQCTLEEIAGFFECSPDTIERRVQDEKGQGFADYHKLKSAVGKISLRRTQFKTAHGDPDHGIAPNPTMQIWLGKNHLGQTDKQDIDVKHSGSIAVESRDNFDSLLRIIIWLAVHETARREINDMLAPYGARFLLEAPTPLQEEKIRKLLDWDEYEELPTSPLSKRFDEQVEP